MSTGCASGEALFRAAVHELAAAAGLSEVTIKVRARPYSTHARAGRRNFICVSHEVFDEPATLQSWTAAHEVAHLVCRHRPVPAVSALFGLGVALIVTPYLSGLTGQSWLVVMLIVGLLVLGVGAVAAAAALMQWVGRRREDEADDQAARWGYPVTAAVRDYLKADDSRTRRGAGQIHRIPDDRYARHQAFRACQAGRRSAVSAWRHPDGGSSGTCTVAEEGS